MSSVNAMTVYLWNIAGADREVPFGAYPALVADSLTGTLKNAFGNQSEIA